MQMHNQNGAPLLGFLIYVQHPYSGSSPPGSPIKETSPVPYQSSPPDQFHPELANTDRFIPSGGEEPPPEFEPYDTEYEVTSGGCVVSHDTHLNQDGECTIRTIR